MNDRNATDGDTVAVHYTGTLDNGQVFDSSRERDPLSFTLGAGQVIPGFDAAVQGLAVGDSTTVRIESDQAYGQRNDELVINVPRDRAPEGLSPGMGVMLGNQPAVVLEVGDGEVTVDANHPLAGEALTFELELVQIQ